MPTIAEALLAAVQHHQAGRLQAAEQLCRQILAVDPQHVEALHLLGLTASRLGQKAEAIEYISRAIALKGTEAVFHSNLGAVFRGQRRLDEAVACCRRALELNPASSAAHYNLGSALQELGELDQAVGCFRRAVELKPDYAEAHNNLGTALLALGKLEEAVACFRRTLELQPNYAVAFYNLGAALQAQGKLDEAVSCFRHALERNPNLAEAHNNLGNALQYASSSHSVENNLRALVAYDEALKVRNLKDTPLEYANTISNKANALRNLPDDPLQSERGNCGNLRRARQYFEEAKEIFQRFGDTTKVQRTVEVLRDLEQELGSPPDVALTSFTKGGLA